MKPQRKKLVFIFLLAISLLDSWSTVYSDLASDKIALEALRKAVGGRSLLWNISNSPCSWNLVRLDLAHNNFSGEIPTSFNKLKRLGTLYLEENQLNGSIPDLNLPSLDQFNVSFNKLTGPIPQRLSGKPTTAFEGNSLCEKPLIPCNDTSNGNGKLSGGAIAGIVIGCVIGFLLILMILIILCQKKRTKQGVAKDTQEPKRGEVEIPREKAVADRGNASTGFAGAAPVAAAAAAIAKSEAKSGGGTKSLVFFGNTPRVFDLEDY
ncbi:hypothetical protein GH714_014033 [Hevea brasiliensis]|uniref:Leucine-rich repeat-containing N-terminal plant-type domain-containing protein n=1 Tax=Hevea brasiliensis TaxID=3981 RepID=A0A6A6LGJ6_HEVBR|nr:hypothetical protein GH714_014033 [Hevea brasiliensis]